MPGRRSTEPTRGMTPARAEIQRILEGAARRIIREQQAAQNAWVRQEASLSDSAEPEGDGLPPEEGDGLPPERQQ
jgi:hypothetical protein